MTSARFDASREQQTLGAPKNNGDQVKVGDVVTWLYEPRGGYGYVLPIDVEVIQLRLPRVQVRVWKKDKTTVTRWVLLSRLRIPGPNLLSPSQRSDIDACDEYD